MTDPRFSLVTFTQDPRVILRTWKSIERTASLNSWEWIIGIPTGEDVGSGWEPVHALQEDTPNISILNVPRQDDQTLSACQAICIEKAKGKYLALIPDNVVPSPDMMQKMLEIKTKADVIYGNALDKEENVIDNPKISAATLLNVHTAPQGIIIIRAERLGRMGGLNETIQRENAALEFLYRAFVDKLKIQKVADILSTVIPYKEETVGNAMFNERANIANVFFYPIVRADAENKGKALGNIIMPWSVDHPGHDSLAWKSEFGIYYPKTGLLVPENEYGVLRVADILNYIPQTETVAFMEEVWRILAPGGWFLSSTPSTRGAGAFADPRQASYWNNLTFGFFCLDKSSPLGTLFDGLFQHSRVWESFPSDWHKENGVPYVHAELMKLEI